MRFIFLLYMIGLAQTACAQNKIVKYYDDAWAACEPGKSTYTAEFIKEGDHYNGTVYWTGSTAISSKGTYTDTSLNKAIGLLLSYYKNGILEDSIIYDNDNTATELYHYYKNKQLEVHYHLPENKKEPVIEAFDETGKKLKNYIFSKEAEYKGGEKAWHAYLLKNLNKDLKTKDNNSATVTVKILFIVNEFGYPSKPQVMESSGFSYVDKDAISVILASPQWNNAVYLNKPVKVYRIQPVTYQLKPGK